MSQPLRVCAFESRRRDEMAAMIRRAGGEPFVAPSMREVPLESNTAVIDFARRLVAGEQSLDVLILMTGVGAEAMLEAVCAEVPREDFLQVLNRAVIVLRGPKPLAVTKKWELHHDLRAPEPNTWKEVVAVLDESAIDLAGKHVAVQEYGITTPDFYAELEARGATVTPLEIYRWALPEDTGPLKEAIRRICNGEFDLLLWTSAQQVRHVLQVAAELGCESEFRDSCQRLTIASIGPTTSDALRECGLRADMEPSHPKMGHLIIEGCKFVEQRRSNS